MSIPASAIVNVIPGVVSAGGSALVLNGVILTTNSRVPIGTVLPFASTPAVQTFFGVNSTEASLAQVYFSGYQNSTLLPGNLYFSQYPITAVAAYLRGTSLAALTLSQLQAISGTLSVTIDGAVKTASSLNLSAATSFTNAATIIATALTLAGGQTVTFDSVSSAFVIASGSTGPTSTISLATGTTSVALGLAAGSLSQGANASTPAAAMLALTTITQNWAAFMTIFEPSLSDKLAFAQWVNGTNKRYEYVAWDTDTNATVPNNTSSFGAILKANQYEGTVAISGDSVYATSQGVTLTSLVMPIAAFNLGVTASIDFDRQNARITYAGRLQAGLARTVNDQTTANTLIANGYNFYGAYATANDQFIFYYPGRISGSFTFQDEYTNQIWLNNNFQLAIMTLFVGVPSIPYNAQGYGLIRAACLDPILAAFNFGAARKGVALSNLQAAEINNAAGITISDTIFNTGWYLQIKDPGAQARVNRTTPIMTFWYTDGGSVQQFTLASIDIQ